MPGHMPTTLQKPSQHLDVPCQAEGLDGRYWRSAGSITYRPFFVLSELCAGSSATRQAHAGPHANNTADAFSAPRRPVPSRRYWRSARSITYPSFFKLSKLRAGSSATRQAHAGPHANDAAKAFSAPRRPVPSKGFGREILALHRRHHLSAFLRVV